MEHAVKQTGESQRPQRFSVWRSYRRACADGALMSMVVLMFLYTLAYYQIVSGLPISMTQIGLGTDEYSSLLTINGGLLCLLQIPAIGLFQRMSNTRVLVLGMSITAVGYAFQIGANSWVAFAIATVLWTLGELGTFPITAHNGGEHRAQRMCAAPTKGYTTWCGRCRTRSRRWSEAGFSTRSAAVCCGSAAR